GPAPLMAGHISPGLSVAAAFWPGASGWGSYVTPKRWCWPSPARLPLWPGATHGRSYIAGVECRRRVLARRQWLGVRCDAETVVLADSRPPPSLARRHSWPVIYRRG